MNISPRKMMSVQIILAVLAVAWIGVMESRAETTVSDQGEQSSDWRTRLKSELSVFGHRNWIVIADSAYPRQSAPGIETISNRAGQLEVLKAVLTEIEAAPHLLAIVLLDEELDSVPEKHAPGVKAYREKLKQHLKGKQVQVLPHEEIIGKLDDASKLFNVLVLKTNLAIPYTSVFLQLECGYWDAEKERALREAIRLRDK